ncbi:hypothetical protein JQM63_12065 [Oscillibacter valericigenes]|nr:hypothetical protein [Oscillibacter valericigenes]
MFDYRELSLEALNTEDGDTLMDLLLDETNCLEKIREDRILLEQLFRRLGELDPNTDRIRFTFKNGQGIST